MPEQRDQDNDGNGDAEHVKKNRAHRTPPVIAGMSVVSELARAAAVCRHQAGRERTHQQ
jgi:hypothetical protein